MEGYVATIGMFDGVHRGHQFVLRQVVEQARERGLRTLAVTFDGQRTADNGQRVVLTPLDQKRLLISKIGIERVEVLPFTEELRRMTACQFMKYMLKERFGVQVLLIGYDNRFGYRRAEGFDDYVRYGRELGIEVISLSQAPSDGKDTAVSSTVIRQQLAEGRVAEAAKYLGYPYTIQGKVTHGEHVGTGLGFPTANLHPDCQQQVIPAPGVYAVKVRLQNSAEFKHGMMNIGRRPTFDGHRQTLETHIFQLSEDLYGQQLQVSFVRRLRDERRFDSPAALKEQLRQDAFQAKQILNNDEE